jgi:hypothetical protein
MESSGLPRVLCVSVRGLPVWGIGAIAIVLLLALTGCGSRRSDSQSPDTAGVPPSPKAFITCIRKSGLQAGRTTYGYTGLGSRSARSGKAPSVEVGPPGAHGSLVVFFDHEPSWAREFFSRGAQKYGGVLVAYGVIAQSWAPRHPPSYLALIRSCMT